MKRWEDIIKERLEGYESPLPNGSYEAFQNRRSAAHRPFLSKRGWWVWLLSGAVAAAIGGVFLLKPSAGTPDEIIPMHKPVIAKMDPSNPLPAEVFVLEMGEKKTKEKGRMTENVTESAAEKEDVTSEDQLVQAEDADADAQIVQEESRSVAADRAALDNPVKMELGTSRIEDNILPGSVLGLGVLGTLTATLSNKVLNDVGFPVFLHEGGGIYTTPSQMVNVKHLLPIKWGLSTRIAISERLYFTTGLDYILYRSQFTYPTSVTGTSGADMQRIHYLGIPLRLDWTLLRGKWLDVYLGAGLEGTFCVAAQFERMEIVKNPAGLSFLGVGGVQLNLTQRLGLYLEPQLSYTIPFGTVYQKTYQTEHTCMFLVSSGLRITIGK